MTAGSLEFQLLTECCRWAFSRDDDSQIHALCGTVDFDRVTRLARFHRVQGLVWKALKSSGAYIPAAAADALFADARTIVATNLRIAAEAGELRTSFEQADIDLLFVKGLTLAALAYPEPSLKMGWDVDLLIRECDLSKAAAALNTRGYRRVEPPEPLSLQSWHSREIESVWSKSEEQLHVELHTRLAANRWLIPGIGMTSARREVEVAQGISLPTLTEEDLFAYLCVHGASSLWFRLKWITDLAALLHRMPGQIGALYRRSQELGAHRAAAQALLLADNLFGSLRESSLRRELAADSVSRRLAARALQQLSGSVEPREPTNSVFGTVQIHLTQFGLVPGMAFKFHELSRQITHHFAPQLARGHLQAWTA